MSHVDDAIRAIHGAVNELATDRDVYRTRWFVAQARYECLRDLVVLHLSDTMTDEQREALGSIINGTHPSIEVTVRGMREEYP